MGWNTDSSADDLPKHTRGYKMNAFYSDKTKQCGHFRPTSLPLTKLTIGQKPYNQKTVTMCELFCLNRFLPAWRRSSLDNLLPSLKTIGAEAFDHYCHILVHAGYFRLSVIHLTLTRTTGSLTCVGYVIISMRAYAHGGCGHTGSGSFVF